jgi:hypothetical protein
VSTRTFLRIRMHTTLEKIWRFVIRRVEAASEATRVFTSKSLKISTSPPSLCRALPPLHPRARAGGLAEAAASVLAPALKGPASALLFGSPPPSASCSVADEADAPAVSRRAELGFRCFRGGSGSARSRVRYASSVPLET